MEILFFWMLRFFVRTALRSEANEEEEAGILSPSSSSFTSHDNMTWHFVRGHVLGIGGMRFRQIVADWFVQAC